MESFDFDLYEELGLKPSCNEQDVRQAYKKKALVHHPDRNGGQQSEEFLRLKQAYDILVDTAKRQNYDAYHHTGEFKRDGRPLSAKEAAWLVDQQKRSWGVKEIHPFAVCILCDSCPCPADGVCSGCGMTYCQLCVRKMHCRGGMTPHYPLKSSTAFSEKLKKDGIEKEREHRLLKGNSNQWLMHDEEFRHQRDVYKVRAKNGDAQMCHYWAWGQTRYTVHLAMWLASEDCDADIQFSVTDEVRRRRRAAQAAALPAPPLAPRDAWRGSPRAVPTGGVLTACLHGRAGEATDQGDAQRRAAPPRSGLRIRDQHLARRRGLHL